MKSLAKPKTVALGARLGAARPVPVWRASAKLGVAGRGVALTLVVLALTVASASAQQRSFYDGQGQFAGSSTTRGNSSSFYNRSGAFAGSAIRQGHTSSFYDAAGRFVGSSTSTGPRR